VFVCVLRVKSVSEMIYTVSGGTLNPTHSLTHSGFNVRALVIHRFQTWDPQYNHKGQLSLPSLCRK